MYGFVCVSGMPFLMKYSVPCSLVVAITFLSVSISFRVAMHWSGKDHPYLPVLGNLACVVFYIVAPFQRFQQDTEITVSSTGYLNSDLFVTHFLPSLVVSHCPNDILLKFVFRSVFVVVKDLFL